MSSELLHAVSAAEYLEFERGSELKHELRDGEIVPMTGASRPHNRIASNANGLFWTAFQASRDAIFS